MLPVRFNRNTGYSLGPLTMVRRERKMQSEGSGATLILSSLHLLNPKNSSSLPICLNKTFKFFFLFSRIPKTDNRITPINDTGELYFSSSEDTANKTSSQ